MCAVALIARVNNSASVLEHFEAFDANRLETKQTKKLP